MNVGMNAYCATPLLAAALAVTWIPSAKGQTNITLPQPVPGTFQDFEGVEEGELPAGWTVIEYTATLNPDPNLDDPLSASYEKWVVISRTRMEAIGAGGGWDSARRLSVAPGQVVNGAAVTQLMAGKFIYAESDVRGDSQVQDLFSPDFDCTGQTGVTLVFNSAYEQNQDSIGAAEYSVDQGTTWLPIAYLIDRADILRDVDGNVDAVATMTTVDGEAATYTDDLGNFVGGNYGAFIGAAIEPALAPFIQGRINDNSVESKRVEVYRLPQADNKPKVRLRFAQAGTASWYWGLDNIGLYPIPPRDPPARPVITAPATAPFFAESVALTGSAFSGSDVSQTHGLSVWQAAVAGGFQADTGLATPLVQMTSTTQLTSLALPLERFFPGQSVQVTVRYQDQFGNRSQFAAPVTFTVSTTFPPLVPGTFEDFESTAENEIPGGWTRTNQSDAGNTWLDWFVVSESTLGGFGNEVINLPDVFSGNSLFVESDTQGGDQIQYVVTKEYNLTGIDGVWLAYKSNYMQNQDSFGGVEFTTDEGLTWKPVVFMFDISDFILTAGQIDVTATLTTTYNDLAKVYTEDGVTRVAAGKYEDFILTRPITGLGPYLSPRVNDDETESKRYQRYRLPGADNQAKVKFRFAHAGTSSWHWGIDDFGLYSTGSAPVAPPLVITSVRHSVTGIGGRSVELKWASLAGRKYTVQSSTDLSQWSNLATDVTAAGAETSYTHSGIPESDKVRYYRVREQP